MNRSGQRRRTINGTSLVILLIIGAAVSVPMHLLDGDLFSVWFIPGAILALLFSYGAYLRRDRWAERNVCIALAGICLLVTLVRQSLALTIGAFLILLGYYIVLVRIEGTRRRETPPPR